MRVGNFSWAVRQSEGLTQLFLSGDPRQMLTLAAGARKPNWPAPPRRLTPKHNPPENTKQIRNQNTNKYKTKPETNTKRTSALWCFVPNQKPALPITNTTNKSLCLTTWNSSNPTAFFPTSLLGLNRTKISIFYIDNCDCVKSMRRYEGNLKSWMINMHQ